MKYVAKNSDWKCKPSCFACKYWETCYYEMLCEEGEIDERYEWEYRVLTETTSFYTVDYGEAVARLMDDEALGRDPKLQRRPIYTNTPWRTLI